MRRCNVLVLLLANAPTLLLAANACEQELRTTRSDTQQYYMILAGQTDVFYDRSGPTFVMLQRTAADETDVGAFGIYAGERKQPVFGPVPAGVYERFVSESRKPADAATAGDQQATVRPRARGAAIVGAARSRESAALP